MDQDNGNSAKGVTEVSVMAVSATRAMVLAAGFGLRMRPLTENKPKPLVAVAGRALLDHVLDKLAAAGVTEAVINVHYLADQIISHVAARSQPSILLSREQELLGTGGGVVKALPELGPAPFFHVNSDTLWIDGRSSNLTRLAEHFDPARMDALLLMAPATGSIGYHGRGDYTMADDGRLRARGSDATAPLVYAGVAILAPELFAGEQVRAFALTALFDRAESERRLFGLVLDGLWMHVGSADAIASAEQALNDAQHEVARAL